MTQAVGGDGAVEPRRLHRRAEVMFEVVGTPPSGVGKSNGLVLPHQRCSCVKAPNAAISSGMVGALGLLLDHLIRPLQKRRRDRQAEGLGGLEVDDQLELRRLLDGQLGGLGALENLVHEGCGTVGVAR